jgi:hypothetical protein
MKDQDRTFAENVVFTCVIILSGLVTAFGLIQLIRMAL